MAEVIGVKFRKRGKAYFFDPAGLQLKEGDVVVVETAKGLEIGDVETGNHEVADERVVQPLRAVARLATEDDLRIAGLCRKREREAYLICKQKIKSHGLDMKLVDVECSFEGNKILFFFSSDGRVDFRELVKDLAGVFRTRIELRQIGVRDEARMLGGLGICGRPFCCNCFMDDFQPVSTKMAKTQSMSLNPTKISGTCGRLMCCLRYEQAAYEELVKNVPKNGAFVETPDGYGNVAQSNVLRQIIKVKLDGPGEDTVRAFEADEVAAVPGGRPKDGGQPPHVLVLKPKAPKEPEEEDNGWLMPQMLPEDPAAAKPAEEKSEVVKPKRSAPRRRGKRPGGERPADERPKEPATEGGENRPQKPRAPRPPRPPKGQQPAPSDRPQTPRPPKAPPAAAAPGAAPAVSGEAPPKKRNNNYRHRRPKKPGEPPKQEG